eukprot:TRINITY_DN77501_c0_g1_i1.p1 TRINITY_DN77501_c0_g1~~TRINITY_DN77501_c0_g1_i1.p1  ORF type:complete len:256 (-),score=48.97 TRINITY_DN77501_c0_g1_i1:90-794(-)
MGASASSDAAAAASEENAASHEVRLAATEIINIAGMQGYHTSVIVDNCEYFFDSVGILEASPMWSHMVNEAQNPDGKKTDVTFIGYSHLTGREMVQILLPYFAKGSYDVFYKNCNTFSDAALYCLTKSRIVGKYNRIERLVTATNPVSISLLNRLFKAMVEHANGTTLQGDVYVTNPEAADFSVDEVIASLEGDGTDSEASGIASDSEKDSDSDIEAHGCALTKSFSTSKIQST